MKTPFPQFLIVVEIVCLVSLQNAYAVQPPPDGDYPGGNTAEGASALFSLTNGIHNTAIGSGALHDNSTGRNNTAVGSATLFFNIAGINNTAVGIAALNGCKGSDNVGVGTDAGDRLINGNGNVYIGAGVRGNLAEDNTTRIKNVYASVATGRAVYVDSDNKLGTLSSSRRYKEEIEPMDEVSETLFALRPVTFRYKKEVDPTQMLSFGLIAEEVAEVNPDLTSRDEKGNPQTVRYEAVNAMLLNEFLKEHKTVQQQGATIADLKKQIDTLTGTLQKVSAQLELNKSAPQTALNNQ